MNARTKSIAIIVATLLVGVAIGALSTGAIVNQRVETLEALREEGGFMYFLERVIEPTDEKQREEIRDVLEDASKRQIEIRQNIVNEHRALFAEVRAELDEILTEEQKEKLQLWAERERAMRRPGRRPPGFVPGDRKPGRFLPDSSGQSRPQFRPRRRSSVPADTVVH